MTRTAARLAELDAICRQRSLTDAEAAEVKRLARLERQCARRRERYSADPSYRVALLHRERAWRLTFGGHVRRNERALTRNEAGRFSHSCGDASGDQRVVETAGGEA